MIEPQNINPSDNSTPSAGVTPQADNSTSGAGVTTATTDNSTPGARVDDKVDNSTPGAGVTPQAENSAESGGVTPQAENSAESGGVTPQAENSAESGGVTPQAENSAESAGVTTTTTDNSTPGAGVDAQADNSTPSAGVTTTTTDNSTPGARVDDKVDNSTPGAGVTPQAENSAESGGVTPQAENSAESAGVTTTTTDNSTPGAGVDAQADNSTPSAGVTTATTDNSTPGAGVDAQADNSTPSAGVTTTTTDNSTPGAGVDAQADNSTPSAGVTTATTDNSTPGARVDAQADNSTPGVEVDAKSDNRNLRAQQKIFYGDGWQDMVDAYMVQNDQDISATNKTSPKKEEVGDNQEKDNQEKDNPEEDNPEEEGGEGDNNTTITQDTVVQQSLMDYARQYSDSIKTTIEYKPHDKPMTNVGWLKRFWRNNVTGGATRIYDISYAMFELPSDLTSNENFSALIKSNDYNCAELMRDAIGDALLKMRKEVSQYRTRFIIKSVILGFLRVLCLALAPISLTLFFIPSLWLGLIGSVSLGSTIGMLLLPTIFVASLLIFALSFWPRKSHTVDNLQVMNNKCKSLELYLNQWPQHAAEFEKCRLFPEVMSWKDGNPHHIVNENGSKLYVARTPTENDHRYHALQENKELQKLKNELKEKNQLIDSLRQRKEKLQKELEKTNDDLHYHIESHMSEREKHHTFKQKVKELQDQLMAKNQFIDHLRQIKKKLQEELESTKHEHEAMLNAADHQISEIIEGYEENEGVSGDFNSKIKELNKYFQDLKDKLAARDKSLTAKDQGMEELAREIARIKLLNQQNVDEIRKLNAASPQGTKVHINPDDQNQGATPTTSTKQEKQYLESSM